MIEIESLTYGRPGRALALDDVSCVVAPSTVVCILGGVGAGKTTLYRILASQLKPSAGRARIAGIDCAHDAIGTRRQTVFVSSQQSFNPDLTVRENILVTATIAGLTPNRRTIERALRDVGVPDRSFTWRFGRLPKAFRVILWLGLAELRDPTAIILDDPGAGLDAEGRRLLLETLKSSRRDTRSILLTTSDPELATAVADRVCVLRSGRVVLQQTPSALLRQNLTEFLLLYAPEAGDRLSASS